MQRPFSNPPRLLLHIWHKIRRDLRIESLEQENHRMQWIITGIVVLLLWFVYKQVKPIDKKLSFSRTEKLPPGPKGIPLVGNLLQFWKARSDGSFNSYVCKQYPFRFFLPKV